MAGLRQVADWHVLAGKSGQGPLWTGVVRIGWFWQGLVRQAWLVAFCKGALRRSKARQARSALERQSMSGNVDVRRGWFQKGDTMNDKRLSELYEKAVRLAEVEQRRFGEVTEGTQRALRVIEHEMNVREVGNDLRMEN